MPTRRRSRYLAIFRGGRAEEINRLMRYLRGEDMPNYPARRGNRPTQKKIYARPYLDGVGTNFYIETEVNNDRWGTISSAIGNRAKEAVTEQETGIEVPSLRNPRAVFTWGISQNGTPRTSQLTGRSYKTYGGQSAVSQFGKTGTTGNPTSDFQAIKTAWLGNPPNATRRISYVPPSY